MIEYNFKLIIWDFDGVIADSEKVWIENRKNYFNQHLGTVWDFNDIKNIFGGTSDKTKYGILKKMGYETDDKFWEELLNLDVQKMKENGLEKTPYVDEILQNKNIKQCIATGGVWDKTMLKINIIGGILEHINTQQIFTADMVKNGKPEPDLFLLAAQKMEEKPENCLVVEDSIAGMTAAIKAKMTVVAFLGSEMYQNDKYLEEVKSLGIKHIFYNMQDLDKFIKINI